MGLLVQFTVVKPKRLNLLYNEKFEFLKIWFFFFGRIEFFGNFEIFFKKLSNAESLRKFYKSIQKGFQLSKVKSPKKEEEEKMKYTLAFHAEGKNSMR